MALTTRVWGAGKLLLIVGALVGTYVVSALIAMRVATRSREVPVPDLSGRTVREATALLEDRGLTLRVDENRRVHPTVPEGRIAQQDPPAGVVARRPRGVKVWVSLGPRATVVPDLTGQTERTAQLRLQQDGLAVASVAEVRLADIPADSVVAQTPVAGTRADRVSLLVNRGERAAGFIMPDLIGVDGERAADFLRGRGFRVTLAADHPYPGVPAGVVIRQTPAGGFQVAPGDAIAIEVSR
jgi:eukaryotic-like serine/threonine-protein kinase